MGRAPCCDKANVKKGPWSPEEDAKLKDFIEKYGTAGNWISLPLKAGLKRCGKSCRLRWLNYLRPNIKHGEFSQDEDTIICNLYATIGSRWSIIAAQLPGRTDNDIKNYWNTKLKKKLLANLQPKSLPPFSFPQSQTLSTLSHLYNSLYYNTQPCTKNNNLTLMDPISSTPQNYLYCNSTNSYNTNYNQQNLMDLQYTCPIKDNNNNMLVFGGKEAGSCCSSDGSSNQVKREEMGCYNQGFMMPNVVLDDHHTTTTTSFINHAEYSQLQYDLEEVKELINNTGGPGNVCNDNSNMMNVVFTSDENKREDHVVYYY